MGTDTRHCIALGGLVGDDNARTLFTYALQQARRDIPSVGFVATASGDAPVFLERFYDTFRPLSCRPSHLPLFARTPDVAEFIAGLDVVLVGGGNTLSMLGVWHAWGLSQQLRRAWEQGTVLAGWSAGAICWFETGFSDSHADRFAAVPGLGFLPGSCCPHYSQDAARRAEFENAIQAGTLAPGWGIDAGSALHFRGTSACAVLAPSGSEGARFVSADEGRTSPPELTRREVPAT